VISGTLLMHRHQWVRMRTRVQNALQSHGAQSWSASRERPLWSKQGQTRHPNRCHYRRMQLIGGPSCKAYTACLQEKIEELDKRVRNQVMQRPGAKLLMTHPGVGPVHGVGHRCNFR